ncbi:MAG: translation initiation factor IF-2 [Gemmataceae bacterium]|nr:translation initiation factor IF-2 [Gemmataceae bacterium]MCI0738734.1 translation initiation factor IF-2 [Gemmataceae bacterium]
MQQQKERVRVYALARELNVESKDLLDIAKTAGLDVKNQLSNLEPEHVIQLRDLVKKGAKGSVAASAPAKPTRLPDVHKSVPTLAGRPKREAEPARHEPAPVAKPVETPPVPIAESPPPQPPPTEESKPALAPAAVDKPATAPPPAPPAPPVQPIKAPDAKPPLAPAATVGKVPTLPGGSKAPPAPPSRPTGRTGPRRELHPGLGPRAVPPPTLKPLRAQPKKDEPKVQQPIARLTQEQLREGKPIRAEDLLRGQPTQAVSVGDEEEDDDKNKGKKPKALVGRQGRKEARTKRANERKKTTSAEEVEILRNRVKDDDDYRAGHTLTRLKERKLKQKQLTAPRKGKNELVPPITVRALSEALGVRSGELLFRLLNHGAPPNTTINSTIETEVAQVVALDFGSDIRIKESHNAEDLALAEFDNPDNPEDLVPRAPIVTIMGHVDHGKTSLLDQIRKTDIVATEAGGITQVIRAWRVEHGGRPITFLDTPGHEAFTKMRARGAQVTDIAVIVVAADDGVMPQTEEAIQHAKAAGVSLVVAINKVDLPSANINKTRQQLYGLDVLPDNMGGDAPFVETSAATGKGINELLDQLSLVAELKELKANPKKPGRGTCLEAMLSEGEGVRATLLVSDGTLRRGDIILCGAAYGRIRQLYDDLGRPIDEAGPSVPVRITGLDMVPNADDPFYVLPDLAVAREVAENRKSDLHESTQVKRSPLTLEKLTETKVAELKIILKGDFRGSIEAIRKELDKLKHEEVRVRVLKDGLGGITEADVWLALTSPDDTIIVGFNVVPDNQAMALAEEKGVQIRQYDIIYNLANDIRSALEGKLKPKEEVVHLGRAVVRETFKISRVGTVAGCHVSQGTIRRNGKVRVIRDGVVIYPPPDRTAGLESLKRFKEDVAEVREGFECGIKIAGYDDIKVGDVFEFFRVDQVQRTL